MDKLLSIIVPVFKVEKYIRRCLDSIILDEEYMQLLEIIAVNDGSPDNSPAIVQTYVDKYPQTVRLINKENGGHGSAWNRGLQEATGKYIRFLDSDDWFDTAGLVTLIDKLKEWDVDIIFSDYNTFYEHEQKTVKHRYRNLESNKIYDANLFDWLTLGNSEEITNFHHCTYKADMLKKKQPLFLEKQFYDDAILFVLPILISRSFIYLDVTIYNYLMGREGQTMSKDNLIKHYKDFEKVIAEQIELFEEYSNCSTHKKNKVHEIVCTMIMKHHERLTFLPYHISQKELKKWQEFVKERYPAHRKSKKMRFYGRVPFFVYWCYINYIA